MIYDSAGSSRIVNERRIERSRGHTQTKKLKFSLSILMACLEDSLSQEKVITPSCVAETKKACLLYLAS